MAVDHFSGGTGSNSADAATALNDMAMFVAAQGDFNRARPFAERALEVLRQAGRKAEAKDLERLAKAILVNANLPGRQTTDARAMTK